MHITTTAPPPPAAAATHRALTERALGPYFATPCGILAPLLGLLEGEPDYQVVAREDNAVGLAAGVGLASRSATVLMQNSGFGQAVNALASLVVPYRIPVLLVVSMRGTGPDSTTENLAMGRLTEPILAGLGIEHTSLSGDRVEEQLSHAEHVVRQRRHPYALLVPPAEFGWEA